MLTIVQVNPGVFELSVIGMPSPMDECVNVMNIDHTVNDGLKRKLDGASDELSFPCKKVAMSPVKPTTLLDPHTATTTPTSAALKLSKADRDAQKAEKAKERELERQKREEEKRRKDEEKQRREQEREEDKQKREEERLKKVDLF